MCAGILGPPLVLGAPVALFCSTTMPCLARYIAQRGAKHDRGPNKSAISDQDNILPKQMPGLVIHPDDRCSEDESGGNIRLDPADDERLKRHARRNLNTGLSDEGRGCLDERLPRHTGSLASGSLALPQLDDVS